MKGFSILLACIVIFISCLSMGYNCEKNKRKQGNRGTMVEKQYMVIDTINKDTVNWKLIFPPDTITTPCPMCDSTFVVMLTDNFTRVAIIDDKYKLHVYDSLRTIQTLLKIIANK